MYLSLEVFRQVLAELDERTQANQAWLLVSSGGVNYVFSPDAPPSRELVEASDEIEEAVQAVLDEATPEEFAHRNESPLSRLIDDDREPPEDVVGAAAKLELVASRFPIPELRRRQLIKRTAKVDLPATVQWEIVSKVADDRGRTYDTVGSPFGTLLIDTHRRSVPGGAHEHPRVVLAVDSEDVRFIAASLERLRIALEQAEGRLNSDG